MMMLPEMTDSAVARAFRRFARGAVVGLALTGLAACGGGGGKATTTPEATPAPAPTRTPAPTPAPEATPRPPEMTITPPDDEEPDTIEDAVAITAGKAVSGTLSSPTDVDFFRLSLAEPGTATFWTTGEADTVVTLLDEEGDDLSAATTSEDRVRVTTALDDVYARVKGRVDGRTGNYNLHNEFAAVPLPTIRRPFPSNFLLQTGNEPADENELGGLSLYPYFSGGGLTFDARVPAPPAGQVGLGVRVRDGSLELKSPANMSPGRVPITVTATNSAGLTVSQVLTVMVIDPNDCVTVSGRRYDEDSCAISNSENGGGWKYQASFPNTSSCTESVSVTRIWSKFADFLQNDRPTRGLVLSGQTTSTGCLTGTPPTLRYCVYVNRSARYFDFRNRARRCSWSGSDANFETYSFEQYR